jgi:hypothetical protein
VPDGPVKVAAEWTVVPREPTAEIEEAMDVAGPTWADVYRAAIAAADASRSGWVQLSEEEREDLEDALCEWHGEGFTSEGSERWSRIVALRAKLAPQQTEEKE